MRARICDRCGRVYAVPDRQPREDNKGYMIISCNTDLKLGSMSFVRGMNEMDICPDCVVSFAEWMAEPKNAEATK